ncbi:MAG TPA: hypothetical protein VF525_11890 [Pyrinomonadaceae bacterium]|jgi:hypothetical protein
MRRLTEPKLHLRCSLFALALVLLTTVSAAAQSSDLDFPTPVLTNEIAGRIAPRDIGDPRLTSHFYTFNGVQGDLVLNIETVNLDGAVDLFLTPGLRPLAQVTLYAGSALNVSKTVFLRQAATLVLRVQARTPSDADGTYRISLSGTFQPAANVVASAPAQPETTATSKSPTRPVGRGTHRVNSVGARIDEPETAAPKTEASEVEANQPAPPTREPATEPRAPANRTRPPRRTRTPTRTETARRTPKTPERKTEAPAPASEAETTSAADQPATEPTPAKPESARTARTRTGRTTRTARTKETAKRTNESTPETAPAEAAPGEAAPAPQLGATRLVIETRDGTKIEREMSNVSRVTVVNQLIVVVLKNGRIERYPMTNVLRMAIEP